MTLRTRAIAAAFAMMVMLGLAADVNGAQDIGVFRNDMPAGPEYVPGEVIVKFKPGQLSAASATALYNRHGATETYASPYDFTVLKVPEGKTVEEMVASLNGDPSVEFAQPNNIYRAHLLPDDPLYSRQWHLDDAFAANPYGGPNGGGINVGPAWDVTRGEGVIVAVVDTGVAYEDAGGFLRAPDLNLTTFVPGFDFIYNDAHANDDNGHGTHVTGTIAQSTNNALGTAGVAYNCTIMPVKSLTGNGIGSDFTIGSGIFFAVANGAQVINMSLGSSRPSPLIGEAVMTAYNAGVTVVCSSGNNSASVVSYPAAYDLYCIAVGATGYDEVRAGYSNYGSSLDLSAPGGDFADDLDLDGYPDGVLQNTFNPDTGDPTDFGYWLFQGTSMAAPHVAGVAALIISTGVTDPDEVRYILEVTAEDKGPPGWDIEYGYGIVDAAAAVAMAVQGSNADAGADSFGYESRGAAPYVVSLDGSGSAGAVTYSWQQTAGVPVLLNDPDTASPDFDAPQWDGSTELTKAQARLRFSLTVNEGGPSETTDEVEVYIRIPGDANGDDAVNAFDLALERSVHPDADFNGDGTVNAFDVLILRPNVGRRRII